MIEDTDKIFFISRCPRLPPEEALDLRLLLLVEVHHLLGQEGQEVVDHVRLLALGVLGQAGFGAGEDLLEVSGGVEILELRYQGDALWFGGGEGDAADGGDQVLM